jgi:hypothetical protein
LQGAAAIRDLNDGLTMMAPIWKATGISPEDGLKALGIDLKAPKDEGVVGAIKAGVKSLGDADRERAKRMDEKLKGRPTSQLNFEAADLPPSGDLGEFIKNPTGDHAPPKKATSVNLSNEDLLGIRVDDIPEGVSARDYIQYLQKNRP